MLALAALISIIPNYTMTATSMTNDISGVGPGSEIKPFICIQNRLGELGLILAPGQKGDANLAAENPYYASASLHFDGCYPGNTYLGFINFKISSKGDNAVISYKPPQGVPIRLTNPQIDNKGHVTGSIEYTPIEFNPNFTKAKAVKHWQFVGINLSGLEFGKIINPTMLPNLSAKDRNTIYSDLKDTEAFIKAGMNTVRLPISWGYLQLEGPGQGDINPAYYDNYVRPLLQTLTHAKIYTIIDLHSYMRFPKFGKQYSGCGPEGGPCPDGSLVFEADPHVAVWKKLVQLIQNDKYIDSNYLMLDLANEPVGVPDDKVFTIQVAVIKALREQNFNGYLLVEGNNWSGLHTWTSYQWVGSNGQTYSNATLFTRENFTKAGITDLSKILINVHQYLDFDYSGTHDSCAKNITSLGQNGFNLQPFVDYLAANKLKAIVSEVGAGRDAKTCAPILQKFLQFLKANSANKKDYGFTGWVIWSTGHSWHNYILRVKPDSYQMKVIKKFL